MAAKAGRVGGRKVLTAWRPLRMNPEEPLCLVNPFRRFVRNFLIMAALFFAVGAAAILICALPVARSFGPNSGATTAIILTLALCVPLTVAMLVSVLFTLPSVRRRTRLCRIP